MTQRSFPFAVTPGNVMSEAKWAQMFRYVLNSGVIAVPFQDEVNELLITTTGATSRQVQVDSGSAWIQGFYYHNSAVLNLTCTANTNPSGTRADLVVLECKWGVSAGITAKVVSGTAGLVWAAGNGALTGTPKPPVPTQTYGVLWQIPLAQVNVTYNATTILAAGIIDARSFVAAGSAKSSTFVIAADTASPLIRANADAVIPTGYLNAQDTINAAILAVFTNYGGGTVLLSEGLFKTSGSINPKTGVDLAGLGRNTRIEYQIGGGTVPVIYANGCIGSTIRDLSINGGGNALVAGSIPASVGNSDGIRINEGSRVNVHHVFIEKCRDNGIAVTTAGSSWTSPGHSIKDCEINNCAFSGIFMGGYGGFISNNQIYQNTVGVQLMGQATSGGGSQNMVSNNLFQQNYRGGLTLYTTGSQVVTRNQVVGNLFSNNCTDADNTYQQVFLYGAGVTSNTIANNTVYSLQTNMPAGGIILNTTVSGNVVMGNNCANAAKTMAANIYCNRAASTRLAPNWIRYNNSGSVAPNGNSYDE